MTANDSVRHGARKLDIVIGDITRLNDRRDGSGLLGVTGSYDSPPE